MSKEQHSHETLVPLPEDLSISLAQADFLMTDGRIPEALKIYEELALPGQFDSPDYLRLVAQRRALGYSALDNYAQAAIHFQQAMEFSMGDPILEAEVRCDRAKMLIIAGLSSIAIIDLGNARGILQSAPSNSFTELLIEYVDKLLSKAKEPRMPNQIVQVDSWPTLPDLSLRISSSKEAPGHTVDEWPATNS